MRTYNGFTHKERVAGGVAQRRAAERGEFIFPFTCSVCGYMATEDANKGSRYIIAHLEDYRRPLECLPCCRKCHRALHGRFLRPVKWLELVEQHRFSGAWFEKLSMDMASQAQPYDEIYPHA